MSLYDSEAGVEVLKFGSSPSNHVPQAASANFKVLTSKGVITGAIVSAIIAGVGLIFFALFIWKRKTLDPPSYVNLERGDGPDMGSTTELGEKSPNLPIQPTDETPISPDEKNDPFADFAPYRGPLAERTRGHSRNGSYASSMTANETAYCSYKETLLKRALLTNSILSTDNTYRDSVSDYGSQDSRYSGTRKSRGNSVESMPSVYSRDSQYSQTSERIYINDVRMPPQFSIPAPPPSVVSEDIRPNANSIC